MNIVTCVHLRYLAGFVFTANTLSGRKFSFLLLVFAFLVNLPMLQAQDWRASAGYSWNKYGLSYVGNSGLDTEVQSTRKGMIELELERYLLYRLYLGAEADFVLQNQETRFFGGPVDFQHASLAARAGLQWPKLGVYGGVQAGQIWDMQFKGEAEDGSLNWMPAADDPQEWVTGFHAGIKYYIFHFLRLQAEVTRSYGFPDGISPEPQSAAVSPVINEVEIKEYAFNVGISISIPWNDKSRLEKINESGKLPPLMNVGPVNFRTPMEKKTVVTSPYGERWGKMHEGVDLDADRGDNIVAAANGVVIKAGKASGYGKMVKIMHSGGYTTVYAHLKRVKVKEGQKVKRGQVVGKAGNTGRSSGIHLHFEVLKDERPENPQKYIRF